MAYKKTWNDIPVQYRQLVFFTSGAGSHATTTADALRDLEEASITNHQGFVCYDPEKQWIVIAMRGTANEHDMLADASAALAKIPGVYRAEAHAGFVDIYVRCRDQILTALASFFRRYPGCKNIFITGHSLGGALAQICAVDLITLANDASISPPDETLDQYKGVSAGLERSQIDLVTVESPRALTQATVQILREREFYDDILTNSLRLYARDDPVPYLPLYDMGFIHIGRGICYNAGETPNIEDYLTGMHMSIRAQEHFLKTVIEHLATSPEKYVYVSGGGKLSEKQKERIKKSKKHHRFMARIW